MSPSISILYLLYTFELLVLSGAQSPHLELGLEQMAQCDLPIVTMITSVTLTPVSADSWSLTCVFVSMAHSVTQRTGDDI